MNLSSVSALFFFQNKSDLRSNVRRIGFVGLVQETWWQNEFGCQLLIPLSFLGSSSAASAKCYNSFFEHQMRAVQNDDQNHMNWSGYSLAEWIEWRIQAYIAYPNNRQLTFSKSFPRSFSLLLVFGLRFLGRQILFAYLLFFNNLIGRHHMLYRRRFRHSYELQEIAIGSILANLLWTSDIQQPVTNIMKS